MVFGICLLFADWKIDYAVDKIQCTTRNIGLTFFTSAWSQDFEEKNIYLFLYEMEPFTSRKFTSKDCSTVTLHGINGRLHFTAVFTFIGIQNHRHNCLTSILIFWKYCPTFASNLTFISTSAKSLFKWLCHPLSSPISGCSLSHSLLISENMFLLYYIHDLSYW